MMAVQPQRSSRTQAACMRMRREFRFRVALYSVILLGALCMSRRNALAQSSQSAVLDRVVAVVGDQAILSSDVDEEMLFAAFQPAAEPASDNTPQRALERVIDRTLIDQQRALQPSVAEVSPKELAQAIDEIRTNAPACVPFHCETDAGWKAFLAAHGFTQEEVEDHVRERLQILKFIDLRFGVAARIPTADVQKYYDQTLKPEFASKHASLPELRSVAPQIREILRQQQISSLVDQWLSSLRTDAHVRILDTAYRALPAAAQGDGQ